MKERQGLIRVLIVDDHTMLRRGLTALASHETDLVLVGEATNGREALSMVEALKPDVVVMDAVMPVMDGMAATRQIRKSHPEIEVVALLGAYDDEYVAPMLRAGAVCIVQKTEDPAVLFDSIRRAHEGRVDLSARAMHHLLQDGPGKLDVALTDRELEVVGLVVRGRSNREIAEALVIGEKTVKTHISHILAKLGVTSRTQAALAALRLGLVVRNDGD